MTRVSVITGGAGVSASMGDADYILYTNAIGTHIVGGEFFRVAPEGAALVNVASMAERARRAAAG